MTGYVIPAAGRAALLNAAADAHRMAAIATNQRGLVSDDDLEWWDAEPQRTLARELYRPPGGGHLGSRLNAVATWLRELAGGEP